MSLPWPLLRLLGVNRRAGAREPQQRSVILFKGGKEMGQVELIDLSPCGAGLRGNYDLIAACQMFLDLGKGEVCFYEIARRNSWGAGLKVYRAQSVLGYVNQDLELVRDAFIRERNSPEPSNPNAPFLE